MKAPKKAAPDGAAEARRFYDQKLESLFEAFASVRGKKSEALAKLCYSAYASIHFDFTDFERHHKPVDPWEADVCLVLGNMLMAKSGHDVRHTHESLKRVFNG